MKFYKIAADDPTTAKMILQGFEKRAGVIAAEDMEHVFEKLERHMTTRLMKACATLKVSNACKKVDGGRGGAAEAQ